MRNLSKSVKHNLRQLSIKSRSGWAAAIQEAERQLVRVNNRAKRLQKVIQDFKQLEANGHPWPAEQGIASNTELEQQFVIRGLADLVAELLD